MPRADQSCVQEPDVPRKRPETTSNGNLVEDTAEGDIPLSRYLEGGRVEVDTPILPMTIP